ncbi:hypothetical protein O181_002664 [Austropuccinia psidii MF-1]|uniref:Uncharacterized protein n=1 Tax=Austropuccinia psidii MF-1 TaxID=1389203 RepID=A0A9Q3BCV5_9BASI|nr:hypothetical protein [Austropuccinia psidii MF-1]
MPKVSNPFSHIRSTVKPKEEMKNIFIAHLSQQDNDMLIKEAPPFKQWPTFTEEGEYDHFLFIKAIDMLNQDFAIPEELIAESLHSLFEESAKRWYFFLRNTNGKASWSWWRREITTKWENGAWR